LEINEICIHGWRHKWSENIYFSTIAVFPLFSILLSLHEGILFFLPIHSKAGGWLKFLEMEQREL
jgi:hypothetical protein